MTTSHSPEHVSAASLNDFRVSLVRRMASGVLSVSAIFTALGGDPAAGGALAVVSVVLLMVHETPRGL
jgi:hypothetical protein